VRHPWSRTLASHPHGHGLGPAGGLAADRTAWRPARQSSLVPGPALATRLRGLWLALGRQARPDRTIPASVWISGGVVSGKPTVQGPDNGLRSLGRSVSRLALTNPRLLCLAEGQGGCRDQESQRARWHPMTLPAQALIRRFLPHVWPHGFPKVRDAGVWSPGPRSLRRQLQRWLAGHDLVPLPASPEPESQSPASWGPPRRAGQPCPSCGQGLLVVIRRLPRHQRGPPGATDSPCGRPRPAASGPSVAGTVAPSHPCALLPETVAGSPLPPGPAALGSHLPSGSAPLFPPRWLTDTPPIIARMFFPRGAGCLKIPYGLEPRFRSTPLLCRLRATTTLLRYALQERGVPD
jgi:hypothetical protein